MKVRLSRLVVWVGLICTGCIFFQPQEVKNIVKDFNLAWQGNPANMAIFVNNDHKEYGGLKIVDKTVDGIGHNQDFIIARQQVEQSGTVYYIIDIRQYSERFWGRDGHVHSFQSETDFQAKKAELGISQLELQPVTE